MEVIFLAFPQVTGKGSHYQRHQFPKAPSRSNMGRKRGIKVVLSLVTCERNSYVIERSKNSDERICVVISSSITFERSNWKTLLVTVCLDSSIILWWTVNSSMLLTAARDVTVSTLLGRSTRWMEVNTCDSISTIKWTYV